MPESVPTKKSTLRKLPWLRWTAYLLVLFSFIVYMRHIPLHVISVSLEPSKTMEFDRKPPDPTQCAFGHTTLVRIPVVQGLADGEDPVEHQRKIDNLEIWDVGQSICGTQEGPTKLVCTTCRFAYDDLFLYRWERTLNTVNRFKEPYFVLSELVANVPVIAPGNKQWGASFSQKANRGQLLEESCLYWTDEVYEKVLAQFQSYLLAHGIKPVTQQESYMGRIYFRAYAQVGFRYLNLEIMRESNGQVLVDFKLLSPAEAKNDFLLKKALNL